MTLDPTIPTKVILFMNGCLFCYQKERIKKRNTLHQWDAGITDNAHVFLKLGFQPLLLEKAVSRQKSMHNTK